jgi:hypothetical protein
MSGVNMKVLLVSMFLFALGQSAFAVENSADDCYAPRNSTSSIMAGNFTKTTPSTHIFVVETNCKSNDANRINREGSTELCKETRAEMEPVILHLRLTQEHFQAYFNHTEDEKTICLQGVNLK